MAASSFPAEHVTRRQALRGAALFGVAVVLAACGQAAASPPAGSTAASGASAASSAVAKPASSSAAKPASSTAAKPSGGTEAELAQAAKAEGKVSLYSALDPTAMQKMAAAFTNKYGVTVDIQRLVSAELGQRFAGEAQAGNWVADVLILGDVPFMDDAIARGWIAKIDSLPALAGWPKQYWTGSRAMINIQPETIAWNTDLVKGADVPKDWPDALNAKWKGQLMLIDPRNTISVMGWCYLMRQTYGDDYLRNIGAQQPKLVASSVPGSQQLAAGAGAILVPGVHSSIAPLLVNKAPVADVTPSVTCGVEAVGGVVAQAPHPNAARLLFNFYLTPEGQAAQNSGSGTSSVLPNIPDTPPLPAGYVSSNLKDVQAAGPQLLQLLGIH